jgi:hypothetical protein
MPITFCQPRDCPSTAGYATKPRSLGGAAQRASAVRRSWPGDPFQCWFTAITSLLDRIGHTRSIAARFVRSVLSTRGADTIAHIPNCERSSIGALLWLHDLPVGQPKFPTSSI